MLARGQLLMDLKAVWGLDTGSVLSEVWSHSNSGSENCQQYEGCLLLLQEEKYVWLRTKGVSEVSEEPNDCPLKRCNWLRVHSLEVVVVVRDCSGNILKAEPRRALVRQATGVFDPSNWNNEDGLYELEKWGSSRGERFSLLRCPQFESWPIFKK